MKDKDIPVYQVILYDSVLAFLFVTGLYIQIKVIKRLNQDKTVAWQTQICHSISLTIHFTLIIFSEALLYIVPNIIHYSGWWWIFGMFRYMRMLGELTISWHSLSVAVQKYVVIVHCVSDNSRRRKIENAVLWIFLIVEILWAAGRFIRESTFSSIESKFSTEDCYSRKTLLQISTDKWSNVNYLCTFNSNSAYLTHGYFLYFITQMYCAMQSTISVIMALNIIDGFIYFKIFQFSNK